MICNWREMGRGGGGDDRRKEKYREQLEGINPMVNLCGETLCHRMHRYLTCNDMFVTWAVKEDVVIVVVTQLLLQPVQILH